MSRVRLKVATPCACAGLLTPGSGRLSQFAGEAGLVRKAFYYLEIAALAARQVAGFASLGWTVVAAFAQTPIGGDAAEPALQDLAIVQDFMAALPPSDPIPRTYTWRSPITGQIVSGSRPEQDAYFRWRSQVTAHRFLTNKWRGGGAMKTILRQATTGFSSECAAKGGHLEPHGTDLYMRTIGEIRPGISDSQFEICIKGTAQPLGALLIATNKISFRDRDSHAIITYHPRIVVTQTVLDGRAAQQASAQRQLQSNYEAELNAAERWRRTIRVGTETNCGPVLRTNGDMFEIAYLQTREPKWYRRSELWPPLFTRDGVRNAGGRSCN